MSIKGWATGGLVSWWLVAGLTGWAAGTAGAGLEITDADGIKRRLDEPGRVTAVIYSNPALQQWSRAAGAALDEFQGRPGFRVVVVVDLRKTMADWAPGYTVRRMRRDLDAEAIRVTPFYRQNGNPADPRPDMCAVADFRGEVSQNLGWTEPADLRRVLVLGKGGEIVYRSEQQNDLTEWREVVRRELER